MMSPPSCIAQRRRRRRALSICIYFSIIAFIYHIMMMLYLAHDLPDPISILSPQLQIKKKQQQQQQSSLLSYEQHHSISRKLTDQQIIEHPSSATHKHENTHTHENISEENIEDIITDGETIAAILQGDINFSEYLANSTTPTTTKATTPRLRFIPGQITNLTKANILHYCYSNPDIYAKHFPESIRQVSTISDKYKLVYLHLPKSGSSTSRYLLEHSLDGHNAPLNPQGNDLDTRYLNYTVFTFVREPLQRFYSQYDEVFLRYAPWMKRKRYFKHPYPFIYTNITTLAEYRNIYCPLELIPSYIREEKMNNTQAFILWRTKQQTKENGTLALRFEQFVERYDGLNPYDIHLHLQVPHISNKYTGRPRRVDEIYSTDSNNTISNWEYIVKKHGRSLPEEENESFNARSAPRRFKTSLVSNETKQKICRISAIDYCCLNIALPTECSDIGIHCSLDQNKLGFQIQPWQHPHEID